MVFSSNTTSQRDSIEQILSWNTHFYISCQHPWNTHFDISCQHHYLSYQEDGIGNCKVEFLKRKVILTFLRDQFVNENIFVKIKIGRNSLLNNFVLDFCALQKYYKKFTFLKSTIRISVKSPLSFN